jgi:hypothetical protein
MDALAPGRLLKKHPLRSLDRPQSIQAGHPLLYVEINPGEGEQRMAGLDALRPVEGTQGMFLEQATGRQRVHAPFYFVREESYTTYFEKS